VISPARDFELRRVDDDVSRISVHIGGVSHKS
jgi:hypothetical protein